MSKIVHLPGFRRYVLIIFALLMAIPSVLNARDEGPEYQGYYANKLKIRIDMNKSQIDKNLKRYKKDKSIARLDATYALLIQSVDGIDFYFRNATQRVEDMSDGVNVEKIRAQVDKLEIINIRDVQLPYFCDRLYEVGQLYARTDKNKAKQCYRDIVTKFTTYESARCREKARIALDHFK